MEILAVQTGDYFQFRCSECNTNLQWKFLGRDPSIPIFEFTCPTCKSKSILKNDRFKDDNLKTISI